MNDVTDFQRESYRIDERIWDALALRAGERAVFLGVANDGAWIARAVEIGVDVTVICSEDEAIARADRAGAAAVRGSATMIPAGENAYDVGVAMHYLHEIDPGFHAQVLSELARVARRVAIVEPSPPVDPLGKRIAALYGRAKRDAGQFEAYQPLEYWRKLLAVVKADVWQNLFTFTRVPPQAAVAETISLVLDAMAIEEMPRQYLDELRALAAHKDAQLLPLSRIVLVGTAADEPLQSGSGQPFRPYVGPFPMSAGEAASQAAATAARQKAVSLAPVAPAAVPPPPAPPGFGFAADPGPAPPVATGQQPAPREPGRFVPPAAAAPPARSAQPAPFGAPFAMPESPDDAPFGAPVDPNTGFGWSWEPPEDDRPA